jgi:hypothetical protein
VLVLLHARDPAFVGTASERGVFAHISDADVEEWQSSTDIVLRHFAEYREQSWIANRKLLDVATAVVDGHRPCSPNLPRLLRRGDFGA